MTPSRTLHVAPLAGVLAAACSLTTDLDGLSGGSGDTGVVTNKGHGGSGGSSEAGRATGGGSAVEEGGAGADSAGCTQLGGVCDQAPECCTGACQGGICAQAEEGPDSSIACTLKTISSTCDECLQTLCYGPCVSCEQVQECVLLIDCFRFCGDSTCYDDCSASHPSGVEALNELDSCLLNYCDSSCYTP